MTFRHICFLLVLILTGCSGSVQEKQFIQKVGEEQLKQAAQAICVMDTHEIPLDKLPQDLSDKGLLKVLNAETGVYFVLQEDDKNYFGVYVRTEENTSPDEWGGVSFNEISQGLYRFKKIK